MNKLIIISVLLISFEACCQRILTKQAITIADSILKSEIGERLFKHFKISEGSFHTYEGQSRKRTGKFLSKKRLPKSFTSLKFLYHFNYPDIKGVSGGLWIVLDKNFELNNELDFEFIPEFLIQNKESNFISADSALSLAKNKFKHEGLKVSEPQLSYSYEMKDYIYTVTNILTRTVNQGRESGEMEVIEIIATTAKVKQLYIGYYGFLMR